MMLGRKAVLVKYFIIVAIGWILYSSLTAFVYHSESAGWLWTVQRRFIVPPPEAKVIFLTYSRSGSSFLGEVINRNEAGFYHFEPLNGIYAALYGIDSMKSMDHFRFKNHTDRWPPLFEAEFISESIVGLLSCHLDRLPAGMLQDRFAVQKNKEHKYSHYKKCIQSWSPEKYNSSFPELYFGNKSDLQQQIQKYKFKPAYMCTRMTSKQCSGYFDDVREFNCYQEIYGYEFPKRSKSIDKLSIKQLQNLRFDHIKIAKQEVANEFTNFRQCVFEAQTVSKDCIHNLITSCTNATVRGTKVIRMRMENVAQILAKDPYVKIVHYFRDPRGIELSRSIGMKGDKDKQMIEDGLFTCRKMCQDIKARKELEKLYPDSFVVLKYEDLATDTIETTQRIYDFLGKEVPLEVTKWLSNSTNNTKKSVNKDPLGTMRANSTATAYRWRNGMKLETQMKIAEHCKKVLYELQYDV